MDEYIQFIGAAGKSKVFGISLGIARVLEAWNGRKLTPLVTWTWTGKGKHMFFKAEKLPCKGMVELLGNF